jgi:hypothetical protein
MTQSPTTISLDRILEQNAESVLIWANNIFSGQTTQPQGFNWLLLADVSSAKARKGENGSGLCDRKWAEVAIAIYDRLADDADRKKPGSGESFTISSMMLRAVAIEKQEVISDRFVLDVNLILKCFGITSKSRRKMSKKR